MPDYGFRMLVEPEEWSRFRYELKDAQLILFARADTDEAAGHLMKDYLEREGLRIVQAEECGTVDITKVPASDAIESSLARCGLFAQFHVSPPPPDQRFSKN